MVHGWTSLLISKIFLFARSGISKISIFKSIFCDLQLSLETGSLTVETHKLPRANSNVVKRKWECFHGEFRHSANHSEEGAEIK
jgi:hypothetical protein